MDLKFYPFQTFVQNGYRILSILEIFPKLIKLLPTSQISDICPKLVKRS